MGNISFRTTSDAELVPEIIQLFYRPSDENWEFLYGEITFTTNETIGISIGNPTAMPAISFGDSGTGLYNSRDDKLQLIVNKIKIC